MKSSDNNLPAFNLKPLFLLADQAPQRMAVASVTIGPVTIHGLVVWRARNGHLRVFWPSYRIPGPCNAYQDTVEIEPDLREQIEAAIIAAYRDKKCLPRRKLKADPEYSELQAVARRCTL